VGGQSVLGHKCGVSIGVDLIDTGQESVAVLMNVVVKIRFSKSDGNLLKC
jgi:hypothetical protein